MRCRAIFVAGLFLAIVFIGRAGAQKSAAVPMTQYADAKTGIHLEYPFVWRRVPKPDDYCAPAVLGGESRGGLEPKFTVAFYGEGNDYAKTELGSLTFSFGYTDVYSEVGCRKLVTGVAGARDVGKVTIHGVTYDRAHGGECGAGHSVDATVYSTYRKSVCYVFEEDAFTSMLPDDTRELTKAEWAALQRHLDGIMQSVRFEKP